MPDSAPQISARDPVSVTEPVQATDLEAAEPRRSVGLDTIFLGGLFVLAVLTALYAAAEIVLPIVLAFVLNLVFQPVLRALEHARLPRVVGALVIVLSLVGVVVVLAVLLSGPLAAVIAQLPDIVPRLQARLSFLGPAMRSLQHAVDHVQDLGPGAGPAVVAVESTPLPARLLLAIRPIAGGAFTTVLVLFFVLVSGDLFLRRLIEVLPNYKEKRQAVEISQQIEADISGYLATITVMNTLVGVATGIVMWLLGLGSPLLWGTLAFLLNFVPILGPTAGFVIFLVAGLVTIDPFWAAFLPAVLYLVIHIAEGETVTPMLLAARFTVNPVLVVLGVVFWYWMWGVPGAILSTPMVAIVKIICDRIDVLKPVGHFIGGSREPPAQTQLSAAK
jgi:predicted PurR-regulated permease PerM